MLGVGGCHLREWLSLFIGALMCDWLIQDFFFLEECYRIGRSSNLRFYDMIAGWEWGGFNAYRSVVGFLSNADIFVSCRFLMNFI